MNLGKPRKMSKKVFRSDRNSVRNSGVLCLLMWISFGKIRWDLRRRYVFSSLKSGWGLPYLFSTSNTGEARKAALGWTPFRVWLAEDGPRHGRRWTAFDSVLSLHKYAI